MTKADDRCTKTEGCDGLLVVYHSTLTRANRVQRLRCNRCLAKHGKRILPNELAVKVADLEGRVRNLEESAAKHNTSINAEI